MPLSINSSGIKVTVVLRGLPEMRRVMRGVTREVSLAVAGAVNETILNVHAVARTAAPVGVSGRLRAAIRPFQVKARGGDALLLGGVGTNLDYHQFVELGTSRMGAKTLRFPLPIGYQHGLKHKFPGRIGNVGMATRGYAQGLRFQRKGLIPFPAIQLWARRKGVNAVALAMRLTGRGFTGKGFGTSRSLPGVRSQPMLNKGLAREQPLFFPRVQAAFERGVRQGGGR